ncbi:MAG: hypothetical protein ACE5JP_10870 [Candidatus Bipolaricaulia bacterium]
MERMIMKNFITAFLGSLLLLSGVVTSGLAQGTSPPAALFQIGMGARPLGMGGAFVAVVDDESALFYNPAGLGDLESIGLTSFYSTQFNAVNYGAIGWGQPSLGLGVLLLNTQGERRDTLANPLETFSHTEVGVIGSAGVPLGPIAAGGVRGRYYQVVSLDAGSGSGWVIDVGGLLRLGPIRIGAMMENVFNQTITYNSGYSEAWAQKLRVGTALTLGILNLAVDVDRLGLIGENPVIHAGVEAWFGELGIRGGAWGSSEALEAGSVNFTLGASFRSERLEIDYAYLMHAQLDDTHRVSLTLRFGS